MQAEKTDFISRFSLKPFRTYFKIIKCIPIVTLFAHYFIIYKKTMTAHEIIYDLSSMCIIVFLLAVMRMMGCLINWDENNVIIENKKINKE